MSNFAVGLLSVAIVATAPLLLAALGELISQRGGVINLGIEGVMLIGALTGFVTAGVTGNPWLGLFVAIICGMLFSAIHAFMCVSLGADQVISGVMLSILGLGLTTYLGSDWVGRSARTFEASGLLDSLPVVGQSIFVQAPTTYLAFLLAPLVWLFLYRTNLGLEIVAVGEDPETADAAGINVKSRRYIAVLLGGALAGAAGAHLSLAQAQLWATDMIGGRGFIAIALVIFVQWSPIRAVFGSLLFGIIDAFVIRSQSIDFSEMLFGWNETVQTSFSWVFNPTVMPMYPYIITIVALTVISIYSSRENLGAPAALLENYTRTE